MMMQRKNSTKLHKKTKIGKKCKELAKNAKNWQKMQRIAKKCKELPNYQKIAILLKIAKWRDSF